VSGVIAARGNPRYTLHPNPYPLMPALSFLIAAVTLAGRNFRLGMMLNILRQRLANVDDIIKLSFVVAAYVSLIVSSID
jgi:hypothetical protein